MECFFKDGVVTFNLELEFCFFKYFLLSYSWPRSESPKEFTDSTTDGQNKIIADTGSDVLFKFQKNWSQIHSRSENNLIKVNQANELYTSILLKTEKYQNTLKSFDDLLTNSNVFDDIYKLIDSIEDDLKITSKLFLKLEEILNLKEEESFKREMRKKFDVNYYLTIYEEQQNRSLEQFKKFLHQEMLKKQHEKEKLENIKLRERQEIYQREFEQQLKLYKQNGIIAIKQSNSTLPIDSSSSSTVAAAASAAIALEDISIEPDEDDKVNFENFLKDD